MKILIAAIAAIGVLASSVLWCTEWLAWLDLADDNNSDRFDVFITQR